jgi:hypothetical protein
MPMASAVSARATTCAWYQVVPTLAVYQNTVPKAKNVVTAARIDVRRGSAPSIHQIIPTPSAPMIVASSWASVASPQTMTNGSRMTAGSGGNGMSARPIGAPSSSFSGSRSR